jgi:prophage antirepressor-like protein
MKQIKIPSYLKTIPGNAYLSASEVIKILGYADTTSASWMVKQGLIPAPSARCLSASHKNMMWIVSEFREYLKELTA